MTTSDTTTKQPNVTTKMVRTKDCYMEHLGAWIYIVERTLNRGGRSWRNTWSRMPAVVDRSLPDKDNVDAVITAAEVPKQVRQAAGRHFETFAAVAS